MLKTISRVLLNFFNCPGQDSTSDPVLSPCFGLRYGDLSIHSFIIYLFERQNSMHTEAERGRREDTSSSTGSLPKWPQLLSMSQVKARSMDSMLGSYLGGLGPSTGAIFHCLFSTLALSCSEGRAGTQPSTLSWDANVTSRSSIHRTTVTAP